MLRYFAYLLFLAAPLFISSCKEDEPRPDYCILVREQFDATFGIDYSDTAAYKIPGNQSTLKPEYIIEIHNAIGPVDHSVTGIRKVAGWVNSNFTYVETGGSKIGKVSASDLYEVKEIYGCHSTALIISSILRTYDIPVVMVETADVQWAIDFLADTARYMAGHVMSEVFIKDHWVLLDNNGDWVNEYDPVDPYISTRPLYDKGLFAIAKGTDSWDYGVFDPQHTHELMIHFARSMQCLEDMLYTNQYNWQP